MMRGVRVKFISLQKGMGAERILSMLKGGTKRFRVVLTRELEVLAILKGWREKFYPVLFRGGGGDIQDPCVIQHMHMT